MVIDIDEDDNRRVLDFLGLKEEAMPAIRIIQMKETDIIKYRPESAAIEEDNISGFIDDFEAGKVPVHYLTEKTPEDWDRNPVKVRDFGFLMVMMVMTGYLVLDRFILTPPI